MIANRVYHSNWYTVCVYWVVWSWHATTNMQTHVFLKQSSMECESHACLHTLGTVCVLWITFLAIGMQTCMVVFMKQHIGLRFMMGKYHEGNVKRTLERDLKRAYNCWQYMQVRHFCCGNLIIVMGCSVHDCCSFPIYNVATFLHVHIC